MARKYPTPLHKISVGLTEGPNVLALCECLIAIAERLEALVEVGDRANDLAAERPDR